ncbi:MAG TPA: FecR domain-containing protein [Steroidobacteraceae bacterium]|nr:FecR domain-containing protein [Steroidobacteraceae bacterium]
MHTVRDKSTDAIADEAADWVIRLSSSDASSEEQREFIAWLKRSPVHLSAYLENERTWANLAGIDAAHRIDVAALLAEPEATVVHLAPAPPGRKLRVKRRSLITAVAASVVLACVGLIAYQVQFANRFTTGVGEQRTLKLSDGSTIVLNTDTAVRVSFSDTVREVKLLHGEALFNVAKNRQRPFWVRSDTVVAQAVGTSFVVRRKPSETVVTVIEGEVAVVDYAQVNVAAPTVVPDLAVHVTAGTRADVAENKRIHTARVANPAAVTSWRSGRLIFDGDPLVEVIAEFNRYNDVQLVLQHSQLSDERISGVFDADQPLALARFLERTGVVEPIQQGETTIALVPHR